jgi:hypothetical protein
MGISGLSVYILRWLYARGNIGEKYTNIRHVRCAFPPKYRDMTSINKLLKELRKEEMIMLHKKGTCISLNPHRLKEIEMKYILPPAVE